MSDRERIRFQGRSHYGASAIDAGSGGMMFSQLISREDAAYLLDLESAELLDEAVARELIKPAKRGPKGDRFRLSDVVVMRLAQVFGQIGVEGPKAARYAEAVLGTRLSAHDQNVVDWVENEAQELFCLIADSQLARIFLRSKEDFKEVDVGAVKPVLFPVTKCEVNVFRAIRPVVLKAGRLLGGA